MVHFIYGTRIKTLNPLIYALLPSEMLMLLFWVLMGGGRILAWCTVAQEGSKSHWVLPRSLGPCGKPKLFLHGCIGKSLRRMLLWSSSTHKRCQQELISHTRRAQAEAGSLGHLAEVLAAPASAKPPTPPWERWRNQPSTKCRAGHQVLNPWCNCVFSSLGISPPLTLSNHFALESWLNFFFLCRCLSGGYSSPP